jgi:ATP-dependent DNA helicase PIF1
MLNEMRLGKISDETLRNFQDLKRPLDFNDGLEVTELSVNFTRLMHCDADVFPFRFPTRGEVESSNQRRLKALTGKSYRYDSLDGGDIKIRDRLLANMMAPPSLELKKGAQVMLIKNMDETLVNGTLGTVVKFMSQATFEVSGGSGGVEPGFDARRRAFTNALAEGFKGDTTEYPLVAFHAADGTVRQILCEPEDWKVELPTGEVQASRKQLPLILAWALSIHKAQGQTLERVKVDLGKVFEKGQAYVALSRATTKQGLQVLNFQKSKVMAHARVVEFYNKLYSVEAAMQKKAAGSITNYTVKQPAPAPRGGSARNPVSVFDEDEEEAMAAYG